LDLPPEYQGLLTTDDQETNLHAGGWLLQIPVGHMGYEGTAMCNYLPDNVCVVQSSHLEAGVAHAQFRFGW
jgi:hypothetical protein